MAIVNGYCTEDEFRAEFGDQVASKLPQNLIESAINASSRAIDFYTGRRFWLDPIPTVMRYRGVDAYDAEIEDIGDLTGLAIATGTDGTFTTAWTSADYELGPLNADALGGAYAWWTLTAVGGQTIPYGRRATLQITARHGWSAIPDPVRKACTLRSVALFKRKEAPFGVAGFNDFGAVRISRRDPDVIDLLHHFIKIRVGAV